VPQPVWKHGALLFAIGRSMRRRRRRRRFRVVVVAVIGVVIVFAVGSTLTASNSVPASQAGSSVQAITAAALQPVFCRTNGIMPTGLVSGAGATVTGTTGADLLIGSGGIAQNLVGNGGNDCIVAGAVPAGKTTKLNAKTGTLSACVKGPGPGTYTYGPGCSFKG